MSRDPIEENGGTCLYLSIGNALINSVDQYGLHPAALIAKEVLKDAIGDILFSVLSAWYRQFVTGGTVLFHAHTYGWMFDEWHEIPLHSFSRMESVTEQTLKDIAKKIPGHITDEFIFSKLSATTLAKTIAAKTKTVLSPREINLANKLVKQEIATIRSDIVDLLSSMAISDIKVSHYIRYTEERPCSWCFQIQETVSFLLFGKKETLTEIFEKRCFKNDGKTVEIAKDHFRSWGIDECPCKEGSKK